MLAIIGGTGFYHIEGVDLVNEIVQKTPFGMPSAPVSLLNFKGSPFLFLPRHGVQHQFLPHEINYRANIYTLKKCGALQVISVSAVGSLREDIHPGEFVIPSQYFDWTKGHREKTFFGEGISAHISTATPICENMSRWLEEAIKALNFKGHTQKTYAGVDGPRLGTKAESHFLRIAQCDIVGMTNVPEVFLAREAQLCYATLGIVTDYDCWMEDPYFHVSVPAMISRYKDSLQKAKQLLFYLLGSSLPEINPAHRETLNEALLSSEESLSADKKELLSVLRK